MTADMELVLDIVASLEAGGHRVELAEEAAQAMMLQPKPDAIIVDAGVARLDDRVRAWADREGVAIVMVGPEAAAKVAARLGAGFIERPAGVIPSRGRVSRGEGFLTDPEPLWPLVLLDTLESVVAKRSEPDSGPPARVSANPVVAAASASGDAAPRDPLGSVLVVEDDDENRATILDVLSDHGFRVVGARDGVEALELLGGRAAPPQAILIDLMMPRMNGWELQKALVENPKLAGVPVVVISVLAPATELKGVVAAQLHKPLDLHELLATMESVVEHPGRHG